MTPQTVGPLRAALDGGASARLTFGASLLLVLLIAVADYNSGYDVRLAILYLVPVAWTTWRLGGGAGAFMACVAAACWLLSFGSSHPYRDPLFFYWEGAITGVTFLIIVMLLARLHRALARSDERFVTVLDELGAAVHVQDPRSGATLYGNRHYRSTFGAAVPPPAGPAGEIYHEATRSWFLVHSRSLRWTDGREAVLRVFSDITEERRARELIARHREEAHQTSRLVALGEFASAVAHELSQPLAAIATYNNACLRLLQSGAADSDELRAAMQKCREQAQRAGGILQRLRELMRQPGPALAPLDLNAVARSAVGLASAAAKEAGVEIELELEPRPLTAAADEILIEQVILNLLRNALEAIPPGSAERRVVVSTASQDRDSAALRVIDWGTGVDASIAPRLFDAFVSSKPGGMGLGLSICRSVIEAHGGTIGFKPNGARGSCFEISLPAAA